MVQEGWRDVMRSKDAEKKKKADETEEIRKKQVEKNLYLVKFAAAKFRRTGIPWEELFSIGSIGLVKAVNAFDESRGVCFSTYANRCIENEILMVLRKYRKRVREISIERILEEEFRGHQHLIEEQIRREEERIWYEYEREEETEMMDALIGSLPKREQLIIRLRFGLNDPEEETRTQQEVACIIGISQSYLSRLEKRIMQKLKEKIILYADA